MTHEKILLMWHALAARVVTVYRAALGDDLLAIALFGSVARGQPRPDSDVDLYVVMRTRIERLLDPRLTEIRRVHESAEYRALADAGYRPDPMPVFHTVEELRRHPWLLLDICDHGVILHDPTGVLTRELNAVRRRLRELGSKRVELPDGSWYWDLKPDWRPGEVIEL